MINPYEYRKKAQLAIRGVDYNVQPLNNNQNTVQQQSTNEEEQNWFVRGLSTLGNVVKNVVQGCVKSLEGIVDAGAMLVGLFGADVDSFVNYDFTADVFGSDEEGEGLLEWSWGRALSNASYLEDDNFVNQIANGVGGMLPTIGLAALSGGTSLAGTVAGKALNIGSKVAFVAGAAGNASEEAFKQGATYGQALGYGALSGAIEAGTEYIGGRVMGDSTKNAKTALGWLMQKTGTEKILSNTAGRAAYTFISEGMEEVLSDLLNPVAKRITGVDKDATVDWGQLPKTFLVGGATAIALNGLQNGASALINSERGGKHYVRVAEEMQSIENTVGAQATLQSKKGISQESYDAIGTRANERTLSSLETMSSEFKKMTSEERANALKTIADYSPTIASVFEENGDIKASVMKDMQESITNKVVGNSSADLVLRGDEVKATLAEVNEKNGYNLEIDNDALTEVERGNYTKEIKAIDGISKITETGLHLVIIKNNENVNAFIDPKSNIIYATRETLTNGTWANKLAHEITHFAEDSKEFKNFVDYVLEDQKMVKNAINDIIKAGYKLSENDLTRTVSKLASNKKLTQKENLAYSELIAHISEKLFTDEKSINRLARSDKGLFNKIKNRISDMIDALKDTNAKETVQKLRKAEKLFNNALQSIAKEKEEFARKLRKTTNEYKRDKKIYNMLEEDERASWLEEHGYVAEDFNDDVLDNGERQENNLEPALSFDLKNKLDNYSENEIQSIESKSIYKVAKSESDIDNFIKESLETNDEKRLYIGKIKSKLSLEINKTTGLNVENKSIALSSSDIRHIFNNHSGNKETQRGQIPINFDNFNYVLQTIVSPDSIERNDLKNSIGIIFKKNINGKITAVTVFSEKKKALTLKSAWITNEKQQSSLTSDVQAPNLTSKTGQSSNAVLNNNISQNLENATQKGEKPENRIKFSLKNTVEDDVVKEFGKTYRWSETGYILKDGTRLDLSGRNEGAPGGYRAIDHRDIFSSYEDIDGTEAMIEFMGRGNIRVSPEYPGINLQVEPTEEQYRQIGEMVEKLGWKEKSFSVDFDNDNGETIDGLTYEGNVSFRKVISDIRYYFKEGKKPHQSELSKFRYSLKEELNHFGEVKIDDEKEYHKLERELKRRNGNHPSEIDWAITDKFLYIVKNNTFNGFTPIVRIDCDKHEKLFMRLIRMIDYDNYSSEKTIEKWLDEIYSHPDFFKWTSEESDLSSNYDEIAITADEKQKPLNNSFDSKGRELSKEQIEFFKDSQVRDRYGRLREVYHGTYGEFYTFDKALLGKNFGDDAKLGFFFTASKTLAEDYSVSAKEHKRFNIIHKVADGNEEVLRFLSDEKNLSNYDVVKSVIDRESYGEIRKIDSDLQENQNDVFSVYLDIKNPYIENWERKAHYKLDMIRAVTKARANNHDGVIIKRVDASVTESRPAADLYVVFEPNQIKLVDNKNPTKNLDMRFSLKQDSDGRQLSERQKQFFKDSKVLDEYGNLLVVYHSTNNYEEKNIWNNRLKSWDTEYTPFTVFKTQYDEQAGHFFGKDINNAGGYGDRIYKVYLNLINPLTVDCKGSSYADIEFNKMHKDTYEWAIWAKQKGYDGVIFKNIRDGVDYGAMQKTTDEYVAFYANQIKNIDNFNPTKNEDIRFSLKDIDKYNEKTYNNYGWVAVNDVLRDGEYKDFNKKFSNLSADIKKNRTANGEYIVPVNNMYGKEFGVDNVLVYVKGKFDNPIITKVVKINLENETDIEIVRGDIYEWERKGWSRTSDVIAQVYGDGLVREYSIDDFPKYQELSRQGQESQRDERNDRDLQDGERSDREIKFALKPASDIKAKANLVYDSVYTKKETRQIIEDILSYTESQIDDITEGDYIASIKGKTSIIETLFEKLNSAEGQSKTKIAREMADHIVNAISVEEVAKTETAEESFRELKAFRPYLHSIDTSAYSKEIRTVKGNNALILQWGKKGGMEIYDVVRNLQEEGFLPQINLQDAFNDFDLFEQFTDYYKSLLDDVNNASKTALSLVLSEDKLNALKESIAKDLLEMVKEGGELSTLGKLKETFTTSIKELKQQFAKNANYWKAKATYQGDIWRTVADLRGYTEKGKIEKLGSATVLKDPYFKKMLEDMGKITWGGKIDPVKARACMQGLKQFFNKDNKLLQDYFEATYGETLSIGDISQATTEIEGTSNSMFNHLLDQFAELELAKKEDGTYKTTYLTTEELKATATILKMCKHFLLHYDAIYEDGKRIEQKQAATKYYELAEKSYYTHIVHKTQFMGWLSSKVFDYNAMIMSPKFVCEMLDGYYKDGFNTHYQQRFWRDSLQMEYDRMTLLENSDKFFKENKDYKKRLFDKEIQVKIGDYSLTIAEAVDLYLMSTQDNGLLTLTEGAGFVFDNERGGVTQCGTISKEQIDTMYEQFTEKDKEYIKILKDIYKKGGIEYKKPTDIARMGFSNIIDGEYYTLTRWKEAIARSTSDIRSAIKDIQIANNLSINKARRTRAKNIPLMVGDSYQKMIRYVNQITLYKNFSEDLANFDKLFTKNISDTTSPKTIKMIMDGKVWDKTSKYWGDLLADVQGVGMAQDNVSSSITKVLEALRTNYAKAQLGGNIKVILTQLASYPTAFVKLDAGVLVRALGHKINYQEMDKYCKSAIVRHYNKAIVKAEGMLDKVSSISNALTKGIQLTDRGTIGRLWVASQLQIEKTEGLKFGSPENMKKAGLLLDEVITETQPTYMAIDRSALQRSKNTLAKTISMFTSVPMKQVSNLIGSIAKLRAYKTRIRLGEHISDRELNQARKGVARAVGANVAANLMYAMICQLIKHLYNKDDEDENDGKSIPEQILSQFMDTSISMFPIISDIYEGIAKGYEIDIYETSAINDLIASTKSIIDLAGKVISGDADTQDLMNSLKKSLFAGGLIVGIPVRNMYNTVYGFTKRISPSTAYKINSLFIDPKPKDLKAALKKNDIELASTIVSSLMGKKGFSISKEQAITLAELYGEGYSLPSAIPEKITINGEETELTTKQQGEFGGIYSKASAVDDKVLSDGTLNGKPNEVKARTISYIYKYYYYEAQAKALNIEVDSKLYMFGQLIDIQKLASIISEVPLFVEGKTNKKAFIQKYLQKQRLSAAQKYILMGYFGYKNKNGLGSVRALINKTNLSKEQKKALLEKCGY